MLSRLYGGLLRVGSKLHRPITSVAAHHRPLTRVAAANIPALGRLSVTATVRSINTSSAAVKLTARPPVTVLAPGSNVSVADNPILHSGLPQFNRVTPEHVEPAMKHVIALIERELIEFERAWNAADSKFVCNWANVIEPFERWNDLLARTWGGCIGHLQSVNDSEPLRKAIQRVEPAVVTVGLRIGQSVPMYEAIKRLKSTPSEWDSYSAAQKRTITCLLRDVELAGVGLTGEVKRQFNGLVSELAQLSRTFANRVLDSSNRYVLVCSKPEEVAGIPDTVLALAAQVANTRKVGGVDGTPARTATAKSGPWAFTLDAPMIGPFLMYAKDRTLRERMHRLVGTRASGNIITTDPKTGTVLGTPPRTTNSTADASAAASAHTIDSDNTGLIHQLLSTRQAMAKILGMNSYAEYSLATNKQVKTVGAVNTFLSDLAKLAYPRSADEHNQLIEFAREQTRDPTLQLKHWDVAYWSEQMRQHKFQISDEALKPYFPLPKVMTGLFDLVQRLYGVTIRQVTTPDVEVWHPDVQYYEVYEPSDAAGGGGGDSSNPIPIAGFFVDMYSRPGNKRGGAWMDVCISRSKSLLPTSANQKHSFRTTLNRSGERVRMPIAYLICNQSPPTTDPVTGQLVPSLMTFREVETLMHEFGHVSQHILTRVDHSLVSGIANVEWDAVEFPSQLMEGFCYDRGTLRQLSGHYKTGEQLPDELYNKLIGARQFRAATALCRQLFFSAVDWELHSTFKPVPTTTTTTATTTNSYAAFSELEQSVAATTSVLPPLPESRFLCAFSHIFAGGYAAGYYSYKYAEVMSADGFEAFTDPALSKGGQTVLLEPKSLAEVGRRYRETVLGLGGSVHSAEVFHQFRGRPASPDALIRALLPTTASAAVDNNEKKLATAHAYA